MDTHSNNPSDITDASKSETRKLIYHVLAVSEFFLYFSSDKNCTFHRLAHHILQLQISPKYQSHRVKQKAVENKAADNLYSTSQSIRQFFLISYT